MTLTVHLVARPSSDFEGERESMEVLPVPLILFRTRVSRVKHSGDRYRASPSKDPWSLAGEIGWDDASASV